MRKLIAVAALCIAPAAMALNNRSAVSVTGLDTNPCTTTSPCRSFTAAMAATVADGEIIAVASGGYGSFTIDKGMTVSGIPGVHAAISTTAVGITVSTATDVNIIIRNLVMIGPTSGMASSNGIEIDTPSHVRVIGCLIRAFPGGGVVVYRGNVSIDDCTIAANADGVEVFNTVPGSGTSNATITNSRIEGNNTGMTMGLDTQATVRGTTLAFGTVGISLAPNGSPNASAIVVVEKSFVVENLTGLYLIPTGNNIATAYVSDTLFENNNQPVYNPLGGTVYTFSNNEFANNTSPPAAMTPVATK